MRLLHVSSEVAPFSKTGGLADVSAGLPAAFARHGHEVAIVTPLYDLVDLDAYDIESPDNLRGLHLDVGNRRIHYTVRQATLPATTVTVFLVDCPSAYARGAVYTADDDEHLRFVLLQHAAVAVAQRGDKVPEVIHCHDWQTALLPLYLKTLYGWDRLFADTRTVLTIHNLGYQGTFPAEVLADTGLDVCPQYLDQDDLAAGRIGFLKTGIRHASVITTVSPGYAREILGPEAGVGLDGLLRQRADRLVGILNGIDTEVWNPHTDQHLPFRYSVKSLWRKEKNKEALLRECELGYSQRVPVYGLVARLAWQKGIDLLHEVLPALIAAKDIRLLALGSGERQHVEFFKRLQAAFPDKVSYRQGYDEKHAHLIEAAADFFLMPSLYEPCGLNQMYSLAYGTIPIVRRTGGLADSVVQYDPDTGAGNGIVFDHPTATGLRWAMETALRLHQDPAAWKGLMENAMAADHSWDRRVPEYERVYRDVGRTA